MVAHMMPGTVLGGVFTRSLTRSAAVLDAEEKLKKYRPNEDAVLFIVNSGNANAFTGKAGVKAVSTISQKAAEIFECPASHIFTSSTGVIGELLDTQPITRSLQYMRPFLSLGKEGLARAARAIMTTDTFPKIAFTEVSTGQKPIKITGFAKGSGMIAPNMATMLAYIFTDADIEQDYLQKCLNKYCKTTFNAISVDGDTSTSDTVLIAATKQNKTVSISPRTKLATAFEKGLAEIMRRLAHQIVRDGEGAKKFIEINIKDAKTSSDARKIAFSIANSPLVKTAIAGEDANWGRIIMAIGKSGAYAKRDNISIYFGNLCVARNGAKEPSYKDEKGAKYMRQNSLKITVNMGIGKAHFTAWTCDLTHDYISINADYRS